MATHEQIRLRNQEIIEKAKTGEYTTKELAEAFSVKYNTVHSLLKKNNITAKKSKRVRPKELSDKNKELVELLSHGFSCQEVAEACKVSRQRVYQIKDKAIEMGLLDWSPRTAKVKQCPVCNKDFTGENVTCSKICAKLSISKKNTKNSKWSRNTRTTFECSNCNKKFKKSNYMKAIRDVTLETPSNDFFCDRKCNLEYQRKKRNR